MSQDVAEGPTTPRPPFLWVQNLGRIEDRPTKGLHQMVGPTAQMVGIANLGQLHSSQWVLRTRPLAPFHLGLPSSPQPLFCSAQLGEANCPLHSCP